MRSTLSLLLTAAALLYVSNAAAQDVLFQSNFGSDEGFVALPSSDDSAFEFDYDYADFDGIPEAPNSGLTGGDAHRGLKLEANISAGEISTIAVATEDLALTGSYEVQVDAWLNYNFPAGTSGTTEFGGLSVGHDGEASTLSGASFWYNTDGDTASDYRLYKDSTFQELTDAEDATDSQLAQSAQYAVESLNNTLEPFDSSFPGIVIEDTVDQLIEGVTRDGSGGFRWMTIEAVVNPDAIGPSGVTDDLGVATFSITDESSGTTIEIGTIDNSNGDGVVSLTGDVAVVFGDIFTSVSNDQDLSFGIFDNLIVSSLPDMSDPLDCSGDGAVTGDDVACATADTIADTLAAAGLWGGDLDLNGQVEFADFLTFSGNFGLAEKGGVYANGDIDLNGAVEFADFLVLSGNFGKTFGGAEAVPEPSGLVVLCLGAILVATLRRRR